MGLLRGMARTAVVAGTASSVSGRVQRRRAAKFADRDAQIAAQQQQVAQQQAVSQPSAPPPPASAGGGISNEAIQQLKELGAPKEQGILTELEFAVQKAMILGG